MLKLFLILAVLLGLTLTSCSSCNRNKETKSVGTVERITWGDWNTMLKEYLDNELKWYECDILLNNFLDEENDGSILELVNVYQTSVMIDSTSGYSVVHKIQHFADGTIVRDSVRGMWIENFAINIKDIKISYKEAYNKVMSINLPKPHSQHVTIRKPIGPIDCNPQYIFGNIHQQIWVDATTGKISETNPAFPAE